MSSAWEGRKPDRFVAFGVWTLSTVALFVFSLSNAGSADVSAPAVGAVAWWCGFLVVTVQAIALLWRRSAALAVVQVVSAGAPVAALVGLGDATGITSLAVIVAVYTVSERLALAVVAPALVASGLLVGLSEYIRAISAGTAIPGALGSAVLQAFGVLVVPIIAAAGVRYRRDIGRAKESETRALLGEQQAIVQAVVARERLTMARELHDIAAHHLSGIAVLSAAIGPQIDTDPEGAKSAVLLVREQSKAMLRDLRRLVGLLREEGSGDPVASAVASQSLAALPQLVDGARESGMDATLRITEPLSESHLDGLVGPLAQLAAFRMVQESLSNAARHAPGAPCVVLLTIRDQSTLVITVRNDPPADRRPDERVDVGGLGLIGMRERAELTDADLAYGPTPGGGWSVSWGVVLLDADTEATPPGGVR